MYLLNSLLFVASVDHNTANAVLISLLATLGFTAFSMIVSSVLKKNFIEPVLLGKIIGYYLKDSPGWLNVILGTVVHFFAGYIFVAIHLFLYQIYTPIWYNALFFGVVNGVFGAVIWYVAIMLYQHILNVHISQYLTQLIVGHVIFAFIILYMFAPPHFGV